MITSASARSPIRIRWSGASATPPASRTRGAAGSSPWASASCRRRLTAAWVRASAPQASPCGVFGRAGRLRLRGGGRRRSSLPIVTDDTCRDNSCIHKLFCYDCFCVNYLSDNSLRGRETMSTETVNQQVPTGTWTVDPVHSSIHFAVTHNDVATFRSGFGDYEATLTGGEEPQLEGTVDVASIDIDEEQLKGHLLSPEFFDAERYPRAEVQLDRVRRRRRRQRPARRRARDQRQPCTRSRRTAASARSGPTSAATPASASRSRPRRPPRASASTGRRRPAERWPGPRVRGRDQRRARARRRRPSSDAGPGHIRKPAPGLAQQRPAAGGRRAAARRGGLVRVRAAARDPALRRGPRRDRDAGRGARSCARRCATPTRS